MTHDQACTESACGYCECILIAGVRTDERERVVARIRGESKRWVGDQHVSVREGLRRAARIVRESE